MFAYFAESSFDWQADTVGDVATFLQRCLVARPPGEGGWGQSSNVQLNWIQNSQDPHAHLDPGVREDYPERFWGNIEDLRDKVLQSLNLTPINYDACLLQPVHLAGALAYLCKLAFHGTSMPTSPAPANP